MAKLGDRKSIAATKLLLIGDSGSGKTGALASLAAAGYKLRILDFDNGIDVLGSYLSHPESPYFKQNPKAIENVNYKTCTDTMKAVQGNVYPAKALAWTQAMNALTEWKEDDGTSLGKLTEWGPNEVLVIDSLSMLATAALNHHLSMNAALGMTRTSNEGRRDIGAAQELIRKLLAMLYSDAVKCNVVVISHITYVTEGGGKPAVDEKGNIDVISSGYPSAIGRALSPHIPRYFNSCLLIRATGSGPSTRRVIYTQPQVIAGQIVLSKNAAPLSVKNEYPIATGLADFFNAMRS